MPNLPSALTAAAIDERLLISKPQISMPEIFADRKEDDKIKKAWKAYNNIGEVHYIANALIGASLETLNWYGAEDDTGMAAGLPRPVTDTLSEQDAETVRSLIAGIKPSWGSQSDFIKALGINLFVAGVGYHLYQEKGDTFTHEFVPKQNIMDEKVAPNGRRTIEYKDPITGVPSKTGDSKTLTRIWRPHPSRPGEADSPLFAIESLLDELAWIQRLMNAALRKRIMMSGLFVMTNSILGPDFDPSNPTAIAGQVNAVEQAIIAQLSSNINDDDSPALPAMLFAPFEHVKDGFNHIDFGDLLSEVILKERDAVLQRIATSLDIPTEFVTGIGEVNHWSAWLIRDLLWTQHVQPLATLIANSLTEAFLRPALRVLARNEQFSGDPERVKIWFKGVTYATHPDRFTWLIKLHDKGVIGRKPILEELGIPEEGAITDEEFEIWLSLQRSRLGIEDGEPMDENGEPFPSRERQQRTGNQGPANQDRAGEDGPSSR